MPNFPQRPFGEESPNNAITFAAEFANFFGENYA
jgi:hypothetical protein